MRKPAWRAKITNILPIPDMDHVELADIKGFPVVVNKGTFYPGEWVIVISAGQKVPDRLVKESNPDMGRLRWAKSIKLKVRNFKHQISRGVLIKEHLVPKSAKDKDLARILWLSGGLEPMAETGPETPDEGANDNLPTATFIEI